MASRSTSSTRRLGVLAQTLLPAAPAAMSGGPMDIDLSGRLCLVTGAGHGIGKHVAALLTGLGGTVYGCDIKFDDFGAPLDGKDLEVELADTAEVDITDQASVKSWVARAEAEHGGAVYILVNCAGGVGGNPSRGEEGWEPVEEVTLAKFQKLFDINVVGVLHTSGAVAPGMKKAGEGKIVNISSGAGLRPSLTNIQGYTTAKHAQIGLTKQLALELGPDGINVNSVAPGFILSNPSTATQWEAYTPQQQANISNGRFIQRQGHPNDIAHAVAFLCSDFSTWISGQVLSVDGGSR